jgi:hypothetical protein
VLDDLVVERVFAEDYRAANVNVKILERYRQQVLLVKPAQTLQVRPSLPPIANALQVSIVCVGEALQ